MSHQIINNLSKKKFNSLVSKSKSYNDIMRELRITVNGKNLSYLKNQAKLLGIIVNFDKYKLKYNHNIKKDIFKNINTKEKAYWLGFIAADGYIPHYRNRISITLSIKDEILIDKFIKFINGDNKAKYFYTGKYKNTMVAYSVHNAELSKSIKKIGIVSPKSNKDLLFDFKNEKLNLAYLMGYYDGDGWERVPVISAGSKKFLNSIKKKYKLSGKITLVKSKFGKCYNLYIGHNFVKKIMNNYPDSLPRKRNILTYLAYKNSCECGELKLINSKTCKDCRYK